MEINTTKKTTGILSMEKMDNRIFNSVGSSRIRARWLLPYWDEAEQYGIGKKYEVLIFQKVYWEALMDQFEGIKILDLCDPDWLEGRPVFEFIDKADAVTTSTEELAKYIRKMRPKALVQCIPDRIYLPEAKPVHPKHTGKLKKVVWFGYSHNVHYLASTYDELIRKGIELTAISNAPIEPSAAYRNRIEINNVVYDYDSIHKEMVKADAVLMPEPSGDQKAKFKSNNKTLQAWALRMPVIKTPDDLGRFETGEAREQEAELRRKEIEKDWDVKKSVIEYKKLIETIKKNKQL